MEMELNKDKLKHLRESKAWSQSHLAEVAGLSLRTIQRVEKSGIASPETVKAICASYGIEAGNLIKNVIELDVDVQTPSSGIRSRVKSADFRCAIVAFGVAFIIAYILSL